MCSTHRPFICCCSSQRACTRQFLGFHIKTSPCFKVKLGFIERLNPERELTQFFFYFDGSPCLREIFLKAPQYSSDMRVGQKKWDWKFLSQIVTVQLVLSFAFQGHVSWCIENSFRKAYSNIDVSMSLLCPEVFLLSLSLDDDKHFIFSLQDFLWNVEYDFATFRCK